MPNCPNCSNPYNGHRCQICGYKDDAAPVWHPPPSQSDFVPYAQLSPDDRARVDRAIAKCKEAAKRMGQRKGDVMPHVGMVAARALAGISYDAAAVAERRAIQQEPLLTLVPRETKPPPASGT